MAQNSKGISYGGGNRGQATILGGVPTTMDIIKLKQEKEANKLAQKTARDKEIELVSKIEPEEIRSTHSEQQASWVQAHYDLATDLAKNADNYSPAKLREKKIELERSKTNVGIKTNIVNNYQEEEDKVRAEAKTNPHMIYDKVDANLKLLNFDDKGNAKDPSQLDIKQMNGVFNDPESWDGVAIIDDFLKGVKNSSQSTSGTSGGYNTTNTTESNLFKLKEDGTGVEIGEDGRPVMNVNGETLALAKSDADVARQIVFAQKRLTEEQGEDVSELDAFESLIRPRAYKIKADTKKANKFALNEQKHRQKGEKKKNEADVFWSQMDQMKNGVGVPKTDQSNTFYIDENGDFNQTKDGRPLIQMETSITNFDIGKYQVGTGDDVEDKKNRIAGVFKDKSGKTYYNTLEDPGTLLELTDKAIIGIANGVDQEDGSGSSSFISVGEKYKWYSQDQEGNYIFNTKINLSDKSKQEIESRNQLQKNIEGALKESKEIVDNAIKNLESSEGSGYLMFQKGLTDEELKTINDSFKLPQGVTFELEGIEYKNPEIKIGVRSDNAFGTDKSDYRIFIDGVETKLPATKANIDKIYKGIKPTTSMKPTAEEKTKLGSKNTEELSDEDLMDEYNLNEE